VVIKYSLKVTKYSVNPALQLLQQTLIIIIIMACTTGSQKTLQPQIFRRNCGHFLITYCYTWCLISSSGQAYCNLCNTYWRWRWWWRCQTVRDTDSGWMFHHLSLAEICWGTSQMYKQ